LTALQLRIVATRTWHEHLPQKRKPFLVRLAGRTPQVFALARIGRAFWFRRVRRRT
jgi:hypothetical protein